MIGIFVWLNITFTPPAHAFADIFTSPGLATVPKSRLLLSLPIHKTDFEQCVFVIIVTNAANCLLHFGIGLNAAIELTDRIVSKGFLQGGAGQPVGLA